MRRPADVHVRAGEWSAAFIRTPPFVASLARRAAASSGFRGINGRLPAGGSPPFIPRSTGPVRSSASPGCSHGDVPDERRGSMTTFYIREEGAYREASSADVIQGAQHLMRQRFRTGSPVLGPPALTREFLKLHCAGRDSEVFGMLHLTTR